MRTIYIQVAVQVTDDFDASDQYLEGAISNGLEEISLLEDEMEEVKDWDVKLQK